MVSSRPKWNLAGTLCWLQGIYYLLTGLWPLMSIRSFKLVTGEKTDNLPTGLDADHWLVMTVGVLVTAIALSLLTTAVRRSAGVETAVLAVGAAAGLTAIDLIYVARGVILPIYLVDAAAEIPLIAAWLFLLVAGKLRTRASASEDLPAS
jgi:hypothetical protein